MTRTTIIYSPHPDDETLYAGAYVAFRAMKGDRMILIAVTDGGASGAKPASWSAEDMMNVRRIEQETAFRELTGGRVYHIERLGQPDGGVQSSAVKAVAEAMERAWGPDVEHYVAGSYISDQSADHQAVANGVKAAGVKVARFCREPGKAGGGTVYNPASYNAKARCQLADNIYRAFGRTSVAPMFTALRNSGYQTRIFA